MWGWRLSALAGLHKVHDAFFVRYPNCGAMFWFTHIASGSQLG